MADDTLKSINIDVNAVITEESLSNIERLNTLTATRSDLLENIDKLRKSNSKWAKEELKAERETLKEINKAVKLKKDTKSKIDFRQFFHDSIVNGAKKGASYMAEALAISWRSFEDIAKSVTEEMGTILKHSLLTSSTTRSNVFGFGMSSGESYGFEKAKSALGNLSTEDLMYMNPKQASLFQKTMTQYAQEYNKLYDEGFFDTLMEYQVERAKFQDEIEIELIKMFVENKETFISGMKGIMKIADAILKMVQYFNKGQTVSASETISNYSSKSISVDTTFNITGQVNDMNWAKAGEQVGEYAYNAVKQGM